MTPKMNGDGSIPQQLYSVFEKAAAYVRYSGSTVLSMMPVRAGRMKPPAKSKNQSSAQRRGARSINGIGKETQQQKTATVTSV